MHVLHMHGWALGRDSRARYVRVLHAGELLRSAPVRGPREDVAKAMGVPVETECVFHALVGLVGLPLEATLDMRVALEDGGEVPVGSVRLRRMALRPDYEPRLQPLLVTTAGRSGSTLLMQLLAAHPEIVVFRRFPYESAPARYWLHMLRVLSQPANLVESVDPDDFHADLWSVGSNPYHDDRVYEQPPLESWFGCSYVERLAIFCQRSIDDWYATLARTQLQPSAIYFAEKHTRLSYLPSLVWELYPRAREVFLVRDFRDMATSIVSFDAQRGYAGFGRPDGVSDEEYVRGELAQTVDTLRASWLARRDRAHLVRYEDLVREPAETLARLLGYLGVDPSPAVVEDVLGAGSGDVLALPGSSYEAAEVRAHRTVMDPGETVGRWRDADDSFRAAAQEAFGEALAEFGYS
jgi:hypothetical protein